MTVHAPLGNVALGPSGSPPRAPVSEAERLAAALQPVRASVRRCYERALALDPELRGPGSATVDFGSEGRPARVTFDGHPPRQGLESCIAEALRGVDRAPNGDASIVIPFTADGP